MSWPSMEDKILPATLDLPHSSGKCSGGYSGLGYRAPELNPYDTALLKATWEKIPQGPIYLAWHVRDNSAFLCTEMDPRLKSARGEKECYSHSFTIVWVKYEFSEKQAQARPSGSARKKAKEEAAAQAASSAGSSLHPPASGSDPGGVVRVRLGACPSDSLLHPPEEEV